MNPAIDRSISDRITENIFDGGADKILIALYKTVFPDQCADHIRQKIDDKFTKRNYAGQVDLLNRIHIKTAIGSALNDQIRWFRAA